MKKYKSHFERVVFINRWKLPKLYRFGDWTIVGLLKYYAGPLDYCYKLCFFGLEVCFWYKIIEAKQS